MNGCPRSPEGRFARLSRGSMASSPTARLTVLLSFATPRLRVRHSGRPVGEKWSLTRRREAAKKRGDFHGWPVCHTGRASRLISPLRQQGLFEESLAGAAGWLMATHHSDSQTGQPGGFRRDYARTGIATRIDTGGRPPDGPGPIPRWCDLWMHSSGLWLSRSSALA